MSATSVFAQKEAREIWRTWRIWVLPGIILFLAVSGPVLARFTPELVGALAGSQLGNLVLPPPTYLDSYAQWIKNLDQIALIALIIIYGGIVSAETSSGTATLVLTKPVSRGAFVVVKAGVHTAFLATLLGVGTLITWCETAIVFGTAPAPELWQASLVWLTLGVLMLSVMILLSTVISSTAGAAGAGLGVFLLLSIGGIWKPLNDYSPAGLSSQAAAIASGVHQEFDPWPVVTAIVLSVVLVGLAALLFRRKEL
ncbi:MAG: ABC transporter permease subunit [Rhodoglobus sp.]